jgi:acyl transferase domain-containing protein
MRELKRRAGGFQVPQPDNTSQLFVFSAHDQNALMRVLKGQEAYILENQDTSNSNGFLENLAYTLGCRRTKMQWRCAIAAQSSSELVAKLHKLKQSTLTRASEDKKPNIAFVFAGQGAQWSAMGRELMGFDVYLESILEASRFLSDKLGSKFSLLTELLKDKDSRINDPELSQSATTAVQVALVDFLVSFCGIMPSSVVGHSSGEIAAAYASGMISRETAWEIAYRRGQCVAPLSVSGSEAQVKGKMLAVGLSDLDAGEYICRTGNGDKVVVACINSPTSVTLSGDADAILEIQRLLKNDKVFNRLLKVNVAYHSQHMSRCDYQYLESIAHLRPRVPTMIQARHPHVNGGLLRIAHLSPGSAETSPSSKKEVPVMYSSVTGRPVDWNDLSPAYWMLNMVSPVRFSDAVTEMMHCGGARKPDIILELGPHASLQMPINQIMEAIIGNGRQPEYLSMLCRNQNAASTALETIGHLWCRTNVDMRWLVMRNIQLYRPKLIVDLPRYPWNHDVRYWHETHISRANRLPVHGRYDLIGRPSTDYTPFQPRWRGFLRLGENPWIRDHQVQKTIVYPAAGMTAMVIEGARQLTTEPTAGIEVSQFRIEKAMIIPPTERGLEYTLSMSRQEPNKRHVARKSSYPVSGAKASITYEFHIYSKPLNGSWQQHGHGTITLHPEAQSSQRLDEQAVRETDHKSKRYLNSYQRMKSSCDDLVIPRQLYETLDVIGMNYGPLFQNITSLCKGDEGCTFSIQVPDTKSIMPEEFEYPHIIHPATLDSIFQTALCLGGDSMVPSYIGSIYVSLRPGALNGSGNELVGYAQAESQGFRRANVTFVASDKAWAKSQGGPTPRPLVIVKDMNFTVLSTGHGSAQNDPSGFLPSHHNLCSEFVWEDAPDYLATLASDQAEVNLPGGVFLLVPQDIDPKLSQLCDMLSRKLQCSPQTLESIGDGSGLPKYCISVLEVSRNHHMLWNWSSQEFSAFRTLINSTSGLLWLTQGAQMNVTNPKSSLFQSMARTIHSEDAQKCLVTVDMDDHMDLTSIDTANNILRWFSNSFSKSESDSPRETEIVERGGSLLVPRLVPTESLNRLVERGGIPPPPRVQSLGQHPERRLKINIGEIGKPDSLYWDDDPKASSPLPGDHVSIKVISASLSTHDIDIVMGQSQGHSLGTDAYGIIESVGDKVQGFAVGDRVIAIARGSLSTYTRCHHSLVQKVADGINDPSIVLMPTSLAVADYGLHILASLKKDQTILVHCGAGTFGQAAIRLAKHIGAKVFTTVTSDTQRQVLQSHFGFPEEWILDGESNSVVDSIMRLTYKEGVNAIFDPTADYSEINRRCVANGE